MGRLAGFLWATLCVVKVNYAMIPVLSSSEDWAAVPYPNTQSDFYEDEQAKSVDRDIIGDEANPAFYTRFDDGGTADNLTDGEIAFRLRMAGDKPPEGFGGQAWIGADIDLDGTLDFFIGANDSFISIHAAGGDLNNSPSTTSIDSNPLWSIPTSNFNFSWTAVTAELDPTASSFNLDGGKKKGGEDFFLTFTLPFQEVVNAVETLTGVAFLDENSAIAYVAATASQGNTLNSDINGVNGGVKSSLTWGELGAISPALRMDGSLYSSVPEPRLAAIMASLSALIFVVHRRRRLHNLKGCKRVPNR